MKLLFSILVTLLIFVASSVFYQHNIKVLQLEYDQKVSYLKQLEEKLIIEEERLKKISRLNDNAINDKGSLEKNYINLLSENDQLKNENNFLEDELDSVVVPFEKTLCRARGNAKCLN